MTRMVWAMLSRNIDYSDPAGMFGYAGRSKRGRCEEEDDPYWQMINQIRDRRLPRKRPQIQSAHNAMMGSRGASWQ